MSRVQDQIAALTRHLYDQHQAEKNPSVEELQIHVLGGGVENITVVKPRSVPLAPGVHPPAPMMGPRLIGGAVSVQARVSSKAEAIAAVERLYDEETPFKTEHLGTWPESEEDDTPSIDQPAEKKKYSRKLEP